MGDESLKWVIDWFLPLKDFRQYVDSMINEASKSGKVLALPIQVCHGQAVLDTLSLILAQVHCFACDAPCCKHNPHNEVFQLLPPEYQQLSKKYGDNNFFHKDGTPCMVMPCPFLRNNQCTIYDDRPLMCVLYPLQPGAIDSSGNKMIALASGCPEARRITRQIYTSAWWIKHQYRLLHGAKPTL